MRFKRIVSTATSMLILASLCGFSANAAEAPKRPQPLTVVPPEPAYVYMPKTEKNAAAFDESKMLTQAVLISAKNKKALAVIDVQPGGVTRNEPLDEKTKKQQAEIEKALAENKKNNPFWESSDSLVRFPTIKSKDGAYSIAAHASNARDLVIYTMPDGGKWNVKQGQTLSVQLNLDLSMYKVGNIPAQKIEIGYINGKKLVPLATSDAVSSSMKIKIPVTGKVEFYTMNVTLDREILANGSIQVA